MSLSMRTPGLALLLVASLLSGCLDAAPHETPSALAVGAAPEGPEATQHDGRSTIIRSHTFTGAFEPDQRTNDLVQSFVGAPTSLRFTVIESPFDGVPATVELLLRYDPDAGAPEAGQEGPLTVKVDVDVPPFAVQEQDVDAGEHRLAVAFAPDGPVDAVVTNRFPDVARDEPVAFELEATVTWHLDAVPAGVVMAVTFDPAAGVPALRSFDERATYALFGPDGGALGNFPLGGQLAVDAAEPAGRYLVGIVDPGLSSTVGTGSAFQVLATGDPDMQVRAVGWGRADLGGAPLAAGGTTTKEFSVGPGTWGISLEVRGSYTYANGLTWSIARGDKILHERTCDACSGGFVGAAETLGHVSVGQASLEPGTYLFEVDDMRGTAEVVAVGHFAVS